MSSRLVGAAAKSSKIWQLSRLERRIRHGTPKARLAFLSQGMVNPSGENACETPITCESRHEDAALCRRLQLRVWSVELVDEADTVERGRKMISARHSRVSRQRLGRCHG